MAEVDRWWTKDVARVIEETDTFYGRLTEKYPEKTKLAVTKEKVIAARGWAPSLKLYEGNFDLVLKRLDFAYIPNRIVPGPAFFFPIKDAITGKYSCAQTKPLEGSVMFGHSKYNYIGDKPVGPRWLGNDAETIKRIIELRKVLAVEGPFDILACCLLCPEIPILSSLTKMLGKNHIAYLRMLGVTSLPLMFDNEPAKEGKSMGAGNMSMEQQIASIKTMKVVEKICPKSDPSECLKSLENAKKLRECILEEFSI